MFYLFIEAFVVGLATMLLYIVLEAWTIHIPIPALARLPLWRRRFLITITLFLTGFLLHLLSEFSGINKWYCTNGFACMR